MGSRRRRPASKKCQDAPDGQPGLDNGVHLSLSAFRTCYEKGIRGFETDIRMTKDGVLVILHDDSLDRTCNAVGAQGVTIAFRPSGELGMLDTMVSIVVGLLAGLIPAWQAARAQIVNSLRNP